MEDSTDFTTTLRAFMARARRSNSHLAQLTGISISTIEKWTIGIVRRPRFVADVLKLARALALDAQETTTLLSDAGHPSLETLRQQAQQAPDPQLLALLDAWATDGAARSHPPRSGMTPRYELRPPIADFVGRERETAQLVAHVRTALTAAAGAVISGVQGMGGIGKTELAYVVAHQLRDLFPDARLLLGLRGTSNTPLGAEQVLQAAIRAFAPEERLPDDLGALQARYQAVLHGRQVLILADDARDRAQVLPLIPPLGCALLVTSRQRFTLPGMASVDLEQMGEDEAVTLLRSICERLSVEEAEALARGCGYLPLALRISSSMLRIDPALPVTAYLERLMDERRRLDQLRDPDDGQLDVEASLSLSYAQLDAAMQQVFRQLGVLVADFTTTLAQAVVAVPEGVDVEATLHLLLRRNLVMYDAERARWRLHDLVRDIARRRLEDAGETAATMWCYARVAVQIAEQTHEQYMMGGDGVLPALARFDAERPHIDAARRWAALYAATQAGDMLLVAHAKATKYFGPLRYNWRVERIPQLEEARAAALRLEDQHSQAHILQSLGAVYYDLGEAQQAIHYYEQMLSLARMLGDRAIESQALNSLGTTYVDLGNPRQAIHYLEQDLVSLSEREDRRNNSMTLLGLANALRNLGDDERSLPYYEQALAIACELGSRRSEGYVLGNLGATYADLGDSGRANASCEQALVIARELGDRRLEGYALSRLARAMVTLGDATHALPLFEQALAILESVGHRWEAAKCRWRYGLFLVQQGARAQALPLIRSCVAYQQQIGHTKAVEHATLLACLEARGPADTTSICAAALQHHSDRTRGEQRG